MALLFAGYFECGVYLIGGEFETTLATSMKSVKSHTYFIGIGSNTNRRENIKSCLNYIACSFSNCAFSQVYRSPSFGFEGHDFFNSVAQLSSSFKPSQLKTWLQKIEDLHGRDRSKPRYSNRTLDIDLLLCDEMVIDDGFVQIPRREILKRNYVLKPLQDLAPDLLHPVALKRLAGLWQALNNTNQPSLKLVDENFFTSR